MLTLLAFLFVLGVLIFVHELGHFLAARRVGVRVLTFSLAFLMDLLLLMWATLRLKLRLASSTRPPKMGRLTMLSIEQEKR